MVRVSHARELGMRMHLVRRLVLADGLGNALWMRASAREQALVPPIVLDETGEETSSDQRLELKLTALLAEYVALRAEIQYRSGFQTLFVQSHITGLTAIFGAAIVTSLGPWLILLVPLESSIFGLWYLEHSLTITKIGKHIQTHIEQKINNDLLESPGLLGWEENYRLDKIFQPPWWAPFRPLRYTTFVGPAVVALLLGGLLLVASFPVLNSFLQLNNRFEVDQPFSASERWIAAAIWGVDLVLSIAVLAATIYRARLVHR